MTWVVEYRPENREGWEIYGEPGRKNTYSTRVEAERVADLLRPFERFRIVGKDEGDKEKVVCEFNFITRTRELEEGENPVPLQQKSANVLQWRKG